jgi:hypothetical protein
MGGSMGEGLWGVEVGLWEGGVNVKESGILPGRWGRFRIRVVSPGWVPAMKGGNPSAEEGHTGQAKAAWEIGPSAGCEQQAWARQA